MDHLRRLLIGCQLLQGTLDVNGTGISMLVRFNDFLLVLNTEIFYHQSCY